MGVYIEADIEIEIKIKRLFVAYSMALIQLILFVIARSAIGLISLSTFDDPGDHTLSRIRCGRQKYEEIALH